LIVVGPCWATEVDGGGGMHLAVEPGEEEGSEVDSTCTGDGLEGGDALLSDRWAFGTEDEPL
jgi:hypothetical protein